MSQHLVYTIVLSLFLLAQLYIFHTQVNRSGNVFPTYSTALSSSHLIPRPPTFYTFVFPNCKPDCLGSQGHQFSEQHYIVNGKCYVAVGECLGCLELVQSGITVPVRTGKLVECEHYKKGAACDGLGGCKQAFLPTGSFYPAPLGHTWVPPAPMELVIARHSENVSWLTDLRMPVTVYEHFDDTSPHFIPNLAAETSSYLKFIIDRYDTLPDVTVFVQGNGNHHNWRLHEWVEALRPDMEGWVHLNSDPTWSNEILTGRVLKEVHPGIRRLVAAWNAAGYHIGDRWIEDLEAKRLRAYCCQQFAASRATIRQLPREFYSILFSLITDVRGYAPGFGAEGDWFLEKRYWGAGVMEHLWHAMWGENFTMAAYTRADFCHYFRPEPPHSPCNPQYQFCTKWTYHLTADCERV
eukprot:GGOE01042820.1.p1 GENE.GGOE01042820.1~~GGOE01042820.1.p1  ORF type:complete len:432 (-),score=46.20 GGOE01042820.1:91-1317(-)